MNLPVHCPVCGLDFASRAIRIQNSSNITIRNVRETCPRCGAPANVRDGTYSFVGTAISAFRAPGVTRDDIRALSMVLERAGSGDVAPDAVGTQVAAVHEAFGFLGDWIDRNTGRLGLFLGIMTVIIQIYLASTSPAHDDAVKQLKATEQQTAIMEQVLTELEQRKIALPTDVSPPSAQSTSSARATVEHARPGLRLPSPAPKPGGNRHARRKAAATKRKRRGPKGT